MDINFTTVLKGIAIIAVVISHVGNANQIRLFAPLGGIGVALFLICSGYGLNESYKKQCNSVKFSWDGYYWLRRLTGVIIPYAITRIVAAVVTSTFDFKTLLLDILCINPMYELGWYLRYIMYWYVLFYILKSFSLTGTKKYIFLSLCAILTFLFAPKATEGQQAISFVIGIAISDFAKVEKIKKFLIAKINLITISLLGIGAVFFLLKRIPEIYNTSINYVKYFSQLGYLIPWACAIICFVYIFRNKISMSFFYYSGVISYELYLIHGYQMPYMTNILYIPIVLSVLAISSVLLHFIIKKLKFKLRKA